MPAPWEHTASGATRERQKSSRGRDKCGNNLPREAGTSSDKGTAGWVRLQERKGPEGKMTRPGGGRGGSRN